MVSDLVPSNIISENQSGFKPVDSCVRELFKKPLQMKYVTSLTTTMKKLKEFSLIYLTHLTKLGMKEQFINQNVTGSQATC